MTAPTDDRNNADEDLREFRRAVADVRPLEPRRSTPRVQRFAPKPVARFARAARAEVLEESLDPHVDAARSEGGDSISFRRPMVPEDVLRRLKRGQYSVEAAIDLHGLGRHAAHDALRNFLAECVARNLRCVRVIHGKGLRSGPGGPVLKHVVDHWLRRLDNVVAFASARPVDGGTGAVYVLLRPLRR
jgi:DNA-nicking Smr family endonuclease